VLVPITVYVVVVKGVIATVDPVNTPGFHVYEVAPVAVNVELPPTQTSLGDAEAVIVGLVNNVIAIVLEEEHPTALVPVTVYIVLDTGLTLTVPPVNAPGLQV
jgi:hypothetical protein